mmetsp:Transcript_17917/g.39197  ORF Transcript_17917/g.39197 Transcript_17917/m.39197 type:complete len:204 (+) Transcript_17917:1196-1807(+)
MRINILIHHKQSISVELFANKLVRHERDGLSRHDTEKTGRDSLPKRRGALLLGNHDARLQQPIVLGRNALPDYLLLHPRLDDIKRIVNHRTKATANPAKDKTLPRSQPNVTLPPVLPPLDDSILEPVVRSEVDGLIASLPHHGRDDALVEGSESLLPNNHHGGLSDVGVLPMLELSRIDHGIVLRLHPDLANLGRRYDHDGFR